MAGVLTSIDQNAITLVRKTPLFGGLSPELLNIMLGHATARPIHRGELLFMQGDPVLACFVVLEGWIKLYRLTPGGEEAVVAVFTRGQSFAEAAAFVQGRYPVSAEAVTDGRLLYVPARDLLNQIRQNPEIGLAMLASTSQHLHELVRQIEQLKSHTGVERVAEFLLSLCPAEKGSCSLELPYDKMLIAGRLGMKPESLSRAFARLRDLGVQIEQNIANIADVERLRDYSKDRSSGAGSV
jgi:CRP-like cAMP-binding protein